MDAVEFLEKQKRMCNSYNDCSKCKLLGKCYISDIEHYEMKDAVSIVEEWSREHPIKTNRDVLFDLVEEHFGSNHRWSGYGLDDSISLYFTNGFLNEEYKGEKQEEQTEDKLSFEEVTDLFDEMCSDIGDTGVLRSCDFFNKTGIGCNGCRIWCFNHPKEAQAILLKWKKEREEAKNDWD